MTQPSAEVIADSISEKGDRVTTMVVTMHRFVLAEFNTHRVFSRNSASSRAIPLGRQIARLREGLAYPTKWPSEQPGMQGGDDIDDPETAAAIWAAAANDAINHALRLHELRVHKSVINRLLEPFMWHAVVVTSTDWDNFFALRCHPAAQPEIRAAAELMLREYSLSKPEELSKGQWHCPFVDDVLNLIEDTPVRIGNLLERALKTSAARCAWVSNLKHGQEATFEDVERIYGILTAGLESNEPVHASPFEHQCTPFHQTRALDSGHKGNLQGWTQLRHLIEKRREPWS